MLHDHGGSFRLASRVVLDSTAYSHLRGGDERVISWLAAADAIVVPAIVIGELEAAFASGSRTRANLQAFEEFLAEPSVHVAPIDREVARVYGRILGRLRKAGTPVAVNDIWIAATTASCAGHLLTFDGDFERMAEIHCTILTPEPR